MCGLQASPSCTMHRKPHLVIITLSVCLCILECGLHSNAQSWFPVLHITYHVQHELNCTDALWGVSIGLQRMKCTAVCNWGNCADWVDNSDVQSAIVSSDVRSSVQLCPVCTGLPAAHLSKSDSAVCQCASVLQCHLKIWRVTHILLLSAPAAEIEWTLS